MNSWHPILLSQKLAEDVFKKAQSPIVELINAAVTPLLTVVTALAAIYCILLGAKLAKAEEPQEREKAKAALKKSEEIDRFRHRVSVERLEQLKSTALIDSREGRRVRNEGA